VVNRLILDENEEELEFQQNGSLPEKGTTRLHRKTVGLIFSYSSHSKPQKIRVPMEKKTILGTRPKRHTGKFEPGGIPSFKGAWPKNNKRERAT